MRKDSNNNMNLRIRKWLNYSLKSTKETIIIMYTYSQHYYQRLNYDLGLNQFFISFKP